MVKEFLKRTTNKKVMGLREKIILISQEINRKEKQLQDSDVLKPGKTYFKRSDLAEKQAEQYWKKHKRLKITDEDEGSGNDSAAESSSTLGMRQEKIPPRKEVIRRLRERGEPIILFGESEIEAYQRLKKLEITMPEVLKGFKNDFKAAMDKVDQEYLNELLQSGSSTEQDKAIDVKVKDDVITMDEIQKLSEGMGKGNDDVDSEVILNFLKLIIKLWGDELNSRNVEKKRDFRGKLASATHSQTVTYIKPLFRHLKKHKTDKVILGCLTEIVGHMIQRNYLRANDCYLEMAIGNAPWPIGVTMVGIHARTGREKISARNVAHVLNDETQRKYIQAVKRLMTQCQKYFPTDPSKMVDYECEIH